MSDLGVIQSHKHDKYLTQKTPPPARNRDKKFTNKDFYVKHAEPVE